MKKQQQAQQPKPKQQLIHELNQQLQLHRIVRLSDDGTNEASSWFHVSKIAQLGEIFACASAEHPLPLGLFTVSSVVAQALA